MERPCRFRRPRCITPTRVARRGLRRRALPGPARLARGALPSTWGLRTGRCRNPRVPTLVSFMNYGCGHRNTAYPNGILPPGGSRADYIRTQLRVGSIALIVFFSDLIVFLFFFVFPNFVSGLCVRFFLFCFLCYLQRNRAPRS